MILRFLGEVYLFYYLSVLFHEAGHALAAKRIGLPVHQVKIGDKLFALRWRKISISPLLTGASYVRFEEKDLESKKTSEKILFWMAGTFMHLVLILISLFLYFLLNRDWFHLGWINASLLICQLFPWPGGKGDLSRLRHSLKNSEHE